MDIPYRSLSDAALNGVVEEFITREGTHYGHDEELSLEEKRAQVLAQLARGELAITFDPESETCSIAPVD